MNLDPTCIGGSKACIILIEMMKDNVIDIRNQHKILSLLHSSSEHFKSILALKSHQEQTLNLLREHYLKQSEQMNLPIKFLQFVKNAINNQFKKSLDVVNKGN